jgi:hypothetical protein
MARPDESEAVHLYKTASKDESSLGNQREAPRSRASASMLPRDMGSFPLFCSSNTVTESMCHSLMIAPSYTTFNKTLTAS